MSAKITRLFPPPTISLEITLCPKHVSLKSRAQEVSKSNHLMRNFQSMNGSTSTLTDHQSQVAEKHVPDSTDVSFKGRNPQKLRRRSQTEIVIPSKAVSPHKPLYTTSHATPKQNPANYGWTLKLQRIPSHANIRGIRNPTNCQICLSVSSLI